MRHEGFDVAVVGLGAAGAATLYHLAKRGAKAVGIDRYSPPHAMGSSHGETRITREAIGEGLQYTPLVQRSHVLWREIEAATGERLIGQVGGLFISSKAAKATTHVANFFDNTVEAARRFGIAHEVLDADAIRRRFPQFAVSDNEAGYYEPTAGFVRPEACIRAQLRLAEKAGAAIVRDTTVERIAERDGVVRISTRDGEFEAAHAILCVGAWVGGFLPPHIARRLTITRQPIYWFEVAGPIEAYEPPRMPVWIWELQDRRNVIYGFPALDGKDGGLKVATEQYETAISAETADRAVTREEERAMYEHLVKGHLAGIGPRCVKSMACLYTATPDFHFLIDRHPDMPRVIVASPCSGHGFKHSAALGESLAQLALGQSTTSDLRPFSLARLAG